MARPSLKNVLAITLSVVALGLIGWKNVEVSTPLSLLNVSYDPTRELYRDINAAFVEDYRKTHKTDVSIIQSHGGSSAQARRVISGETKADVVTLGLPSDISAIARRGLVSASWPSRFPENARPYYSTIVFVVRKGNPRGIVDWPDLVKPEVEVIVPDPKSSGNGKLAALAAWGAVVTRGGSPEQASAYLRALYDRAPFLLPAARAAGLAFAIEKIGDVHLAWENEALREVAEAKGELEIVTPPISIRAEPSVAWVDSNVADPKKRELAEEYLRFLFTPEAQKIIAQAGYRPSIASAPEGRPGSVTQSELFPITKIASSWEDAETRFFADNGIIDLVYSPKPR